MIPIPSVSGLLKALRAFVTRERSIHIDSPLPGIIERSGYYAGIGSRKTPAEVLALMEEIARMLGSREWTLRSGGAPGADSAFERGCDQGRGKKEIFLPLRRFNGNLSSFINPSEEAEQIAALCHPTGGHASEPQENCMRGTASKSAATISGNPLILSCFGHRSRMASLKGEQRQRSP